MEKIHSLCLVDDDVTFQFLTKMVIEKSGLVGEIKIFSNGADAIEFLKSVQGDNYNIPEIILLDLSMPVLDGWGFLDQFRILKPNLHKKITIYLVSSSIDPKDIVRAQSISEVSNFIIKPITKDDLVQMVKNF